MHNKCNNPRIVRLTPQPSFRIRGMNDEVDIYWPAATLNSSADYGVDFADHLCCDETLTDAAIALDCGTLGWGGRPTYTRSLASAWITWTQTGHHIIEVTAITSGGRSLTAFIHINIREPSALLSVPTPKNAPNVLTLPDGTPLKTPTGNDLLNQ